MSNRLIGSDLARAMLKRGDQSIWCAVADYNDEEAMMDHKGNDFTATIVSFENGIFVCTGGMEWSYAVPIRVIALTEGEEGLCGCGCC